MYIKAPLDNHISGKAGLAAYAIYPIEINRYVAAGS